MATRIQRSRAKGWRLPANAVCVTRPGLWGNPFTVAEARRYLVDASEDDDPRAKAAGWYRTWITSQTSQGRHMPPTLAMVRDRLRGRDLACWCPLDQPCHADVLLELANSQSYSSAQGVSRGG